ncbi:hypothetical protein E5CHR_01642 [Variovorax sp. PBL-E5]|nr:hypothetical protein E5CHR_01642 [Variovorax sp. PBL-E5]
MVAVDAAGRIHLHQLREHRAVGEQLHRLREARGGSLNPKLDELLNAAGASLDPTQRKACYAALQKIVTDELPLYIINQVPYYTATAKNVGNVPNSIWGPPSPMDEVYLKQGGHVRGRSANLGR